MEEPICETHSNHPFQLKMCHHYRLPLKHYSKFSDICTGLRMFTKYHNEQINNSAQTVYMLAKLRDL